MTLQAKKCLRLAGLAGALAPQRRRAPDFAAPGRREVRGRRRSRCPGREVACSGVRDAAHARIHARSIRGRGEQRREDPEREEEGMRREEHRRTKRGAKRLM